MNLANTWFQACTAYKKNRFYLFTNAEPFAYDDEDDENATSRDVFNEKPKKEDQITAVEVIPCRFIFLQLPVIKCLNQTRIQIFCLKYAYG